MSADPRADSILIVGAGAVGTAVAYALQAAGLRVSAVASRTHERAVELAARLNRAHERAVELAARPNRDPASAAAVGPQRIRAIPLGTAPMDASLVLLAVTDRAIDAVCDAVGGRPGLLVAHTSGLRDVGALGAASAAGADVGSLHPLASVVHRPTAEPDTHQRTFAGAAFAIEGNTAVYGRLAAIAHALGGRPFAIDAREKPLYHLGASMLAAFSASLGEFAWHRLRAAGAGEAIASAGVSHLLETVARNIGSASTPAAALTGPIARGDADGIRRQVAAARSLSPEADALYCTLATQAIQLAMQAGRIDATTARTLNAALVSTNT